MAGAKSKDKGSGFEKKVCRALTKWITGSESPEIFWRSATSGGKATIEGNSCHMGGDIVALHEDSNWFCKHYVVECKFYKDFRFESIFNKGGLLFDWWSQVRGDADRDKKQPILIFKRNFQKPWIMISIGFMRKLRYVFGDPEIEFFRILVGHFGVVFVFRFEEWLDWIDPETLKTWSERNWSDNEVYRLHNEASLSKGNEREKKSEGGEGEVVLEAPDGESKSQSNGGSGGAKKE